MHRLDVIYSRGDTTRSSRTLMPIRTRVSQRFAEAVTAALAGISPSQASYKTEVSYEYIRRMRMGHIPSPEIIERFAKGLGAEVDVLLEAAGYKESSDPVVAVKLALRANRQLSEATKDQIVQFVEQKLREKHERDAGEESS
jgi:transcriptional regulator with XRE-family HTH domain